MQEQNLNDMWQVDVNGTIYEAAFSELGEWIGGGSLLPEDKVRKGNLRWIEARKVPSLVPFFNAKASGQPMPVMVSTTVAEPLPEPAVTVETPVEIPIVAEPVVHEIAAPQNIVHSALHVTNADFCVLHAGVESTYLCDGCGNGYCRVCPNSYGGTVKVCPMCGAMCRPKGEAIAAKQKSDHRTAAAAEGLGVADFFASLSYPFKFKVSLFFGAVLFMLLTVGKGAGAMGGVYMVAGGFFAGMSANALTFAVLANTINNFIQGKFDESFMPDFDDWSYWDDVVHPFFLSIAAYLSSFGPFLVVLAVGFYLVTSTVNSSVDSYKNELEKIPGTNVYAGRELADQSNDVKSALKDVDQRQRDRIAATTEDSDESLLTPASPTPFIDEETRQQEELWAMAQQHQKSQLESVVGKAPETEAVEEAAMIRAFLNLAAPLVVIGAITFLWGLFFFPAACAVAGYTRLFTATINPLVGLDTIKRLGFDYVKILLMGLVLLVVSVIVSGILAVLFGAFDLPRMGNLPATAIGAVFSFYVYVVFSCVLGFALYKSADKLGLAR